MQGFQVHRKAGWDTHGLPVEIEVEKQLGLTCKPDIEQYGIEQFNHQCRQSVLAYEKLWREFTERTRLLGGYGSPVYHDDQRLH
jgi:isoleucyl-tRNA synthetase